MTSLHSPTFVARVVARAVALPSSPPMPLPPPRSPPRCASQYKRKGNALTINKFPVSLYFLVQFYKTKTGTA
jgi:hypothetical protein